MLQWYDVNGSAQPMPYEEGLTTIYFRTKATETDDGWKWKEIAYPIDNKIAAIEQCIDELIANMMMDDLDLIKAMLPFADTAKKVDIYRELLECKLQSQYLARGYTEREPSSYKDSPVVRYNQDAKDFELYKGRAMIYGLTKINEYRQSGVIPTLDEFLDGIGDIHWTIDPDNTNSNEGMVIEE